MRPPLRRRLAAVLLLPAAAAGTLASCGGGGDKEDAQKLLDRAFRQPIRSADIDVDATLQAKGLSGFDKPIRIHASGPYRENKDKLPSFDIDLKVGAGGQGQVISTGRLSTGSRAFVKFEDTFYELPKSSVDRANRSLRSDRRQRGLLKNAGLDARSWVKQAKVEGSDSVAGTDTTHVAGTLDVRRVLRDLNRFVQRSGKALGAAAGQVPRPLPQAELDKIAQVVKDPVFDIYVGKDDHAIRRLAARVDLEVPKRDRASVGGLSGGSVQFSIQFSKVNGNQKIVAPAKARPLSDLTNTLGAGALDGGIGGLGGGSQSGGGSSGSTGTSGGGTSTSPGADAFKKYSHCLDKAPPEDTAALQRCSKLLQ